MTAAGTRFFHLSLSGPAFGRLQEAEEFYLAGNLNEALAATQQAWREHSRDPDVFRVLAYIHMARGEYQPAAQAAYQAVVVDESNPASYATLAQVYLTFNMIGNARETLEAARQRYPGDAALMVLAADLHFRDRKDTEAASLAEQALAVNPSDGYARALLGLYHLRKKRYEQAAEFLGEAVQVYPARWDYQRDFGIALMHTGPHQVARDVLERSLQLNPADDSTKRYLWYALRMLRPNPSPLTTVSFYFFQHPEFGWLLNILGTITALTGIFWLIIALTSGLIHGETLFGILDAIKYAVLCLLGGMALNGLTAPGIGMRSRRGKRFDLALRRALEKASGSDFHREG